MEVELLRNLWSFARGLRRLDVNCRIALLRRIVFSALVLCAVAVGARAQEAGEQEGREGSLMLFVPVGYDFIRLDSQTAHSFSAGLGFMLAREGRRFMGTAFYSPFFFTQEFPGEMPEGLPTRFHQITGLFDARISRHQFMLLFNSSADRPVSGGLGLFSRAQAGATR